MKAANNMVASPRSEEDSESLAKLSRCWMSWDLYIHDQRWRRPQELWSIRFVTKHIWLDRAGLELNNLGQFSAPPIESKLKGIRRIIVAILKKMYRLASCFPGIQGCHAYRVRTEWQGWACNLTEKETRLSGKVICRLSQKCNKWTTWQSQGLWWVGRGWQEFRPLEVKG